MSKYKFYKDEHIEIKEFCDEMEIDFASTGMNVPDMYFLKELGVPSL